MGSARERGLEIVAKLGETRREVARLSKELRTARYEMAVARARVERALIKKVGGERNLAPTADDRQRIFTLALDADPDYRAKWKKYSDLQYQLDVASAEQRTLEDELRALELPGEPSEK